MGRRTSSGKRSVSGVKDRQWDKIWEWGEGQTVGKEVGVAEGQAVDVSRHLLSVQQCTWKLNMVPSVHLE